MNMQSFDPIIVTTTSDDREVLERISQQLVSRSLAGCVQISGPISSCYRWEGEVQTSQEWICVIKSSQQRLVELENVVLELHNYDQPQLLAVNVSNGNAGYLQWLAESLSSH